MKDNHEDSDILNRINAPPLSKETIDEIINIPIEQNILRAKWNGGYVILQVNGKSLGQIKNGYSKIECFKKGFLYTIDWLGLLIIKKLY